MGQLAPPVEPLGLRLGDVGAAVRLEVEYPHILRPVRALLDIAIKDVGEVVEAKQGHALAS